MKYQFVTLLSRFVYDIGVYSFKHPLIVAVSYYFAGKIIDIYNTLRYNKLNVLLKHSFRVGIIFAYL